MSKQTKEKASEAYSIDESSTFYGIAKYNVNSNARVGYIKGYRQAIKCIRKELERLSNEISNAPTPTEIHKCYKFGRLLGYKDVTNYINKLMRWANEPKK